MDEVWQESLKNLGKAIARFQEAVAVSPEQNALVVDASIQRFEFTIELFWKTIKRLLREHEEIDAPSPKRSFVEAFRLGWIGDEQAWLGMLKDRNLTSHVYKEEEILAIYKHLPLYAEVMQRTYKQLVERFHA